ncbi:MAG: hypothetical protein ABR599_09720 [Gemmatimonadota bacterium]
MRTLTSLIAVTIILAASACSANDSISGPEAGSPSPRLLDGGVEDGSNNGQCCKP